MGRRLDGTAPDVRRLTTDDGVESNPAFSPDGKTHRLQRAVRRQHRRLRRAGRRAACRRGSRGIPARTSCRRFTPDGTARAVHVAARGLHEPLHAALHGAGRRRHGGAAADSECRARDLGAGRPAHRLQPDRRRAISSGSSIAAARCRGIWIYDPRRHASSRRFRSRRRGRTTPTRCGSATRVYFRSDRNGEFNLFSYDPRSKAGPAADDAHATSRSSARRRAAARIVFEQAGYLHLFDPRRRKRRRG